MGNLKFIQIDLVNKKTKPCFQIPADKLLDVQKLKSKSRPLKMVLKPPTKSTVNRKDLAQNWDEAF